VIGTDREKETLELHALDTSIPKFFSGDIAIRYFLYYMVGLLPFIKIDHHEVASLPYMTRDYLRMKLIQAREGNTKYYGFIFAVVFTNLFMRGALEHMSKRGIYTNLWVINDDDEVLKVMREQRVQGVMTDRPTEVIKLVKRES
jgi:hypothetical protein